MGVLRENARMLSARALELSQTLVRINTVSANSNLELIHFVRDTLARLGVKSRLTHNVDKSKANLFATLGEGKPAGIILSGHTDTVPWDGPGSILQAHQPDEYVSLAQLARCEAFMHNLTATRQFN